MQQVCISKQLRRDNANTDIIDLHGSLSDLPDEYLIDMYMQANPVTNGTIILNCSELEAVNSRGIGQIIQLLICTRRQQQRLLIFGLSEYNRYILEITRLNQYINIVETETQALEALHMSLIDKNILTGAPML